MYRYLLLESTDPIKHDEQTLITFFSDVMHIDHMDVSEYKLVLYFQGDIDVSFRDIIVTLLADTLTAFRLFESYRFRTEAERDKNLRDVIYLLQKISIAKHAYLNEQKVLSLLIHDMDKTYHGCFLKSYVNDQTMLNSVRVYLESNQNTSHAAKQLFIHRNTLIQRIDKFIDITGFDIREFVPGYLIYSLLTRK